MKYLVIALCLGGLVACGNDAPTITAQVEDVSLSLATTGELASSETIEVGPPFVKRTWQYKISFIIPEGTWVKKGEVILGFDAQQQHERLRTSQNKLATEEKKLQSQALDNEQNVEQLKLDIAQTKMKLEKAQRKSTQDGDYSRALDIKKLKIDLAIATKEMALISYRQGNKRQQIVLIHQINQAEVERLRAEVKERKQAIGAMKVKAPKDGIVVYLPGEEQKKPASGDNVFMAQKLIELPNLNKMIVKTTIAENDVSRISIGQRVAIELDAILDKTFWGKVSSLGQVVRVKSKQEPSKVYDATITIDDPDVELMRPGMAVRLKIQEQQLSQVISVPLKSIHYEKHQAQVFVKGTLGQSAVDITVLGQSAGSAYIKGDLSNGDQILR